MYYQSILMMNLEAVLLRRFQKIYKKLETILTKSEFTYINAVGCEFLWMHNHNIKLAEKAIFSYYDELNKPTYEDDLSYTKAVLGICRIYSKCKLRHLIMILL